MLVACVIFPTVAALLWVLSYPEFPRLWSLGSEGRWQFALYKGELGIFLPEWTPLNSEVKQSTVVNWIEFVALVEMGRGFLLYDIASKGGPLSLTSGSSTVTGVAHRVVVPVWSIFIICITPLSILLGARMWHYVLWRKRTRSGCCVACGYCLVGVPEPRCPECGTRFLKIDSVIE